jgi:hypothetical protein
MIDMEKRIKDAVEALEQVVPRTGGRVAFEVYGGGPEECRIVANKVGYFRLGLELIKAGYKPAESIEENQSESIDVEIKDLIDEKSELNFDWFRRTEIWPEKKPVIGSNWKLKIVGPIFLAFVVATGTLAVIGLVSTIKFFVN